MVPRDPAVRLGGARPPVRQAARRSSLRRPLLVALIAALLFVWACGCAPPRSEGLHGRAAFDAWIADQGIQIAEGDLSSYPGAPCGGYEPGTKTIVIDDPCIAKSTTDPRAAIWIPMHEQGHAVDQALGFLQHDPVTDICNAQTCRGFERGAQCVAEVVLGWSYSPSTNDDWYFNCPPDQVDRTRILMEAIGAW